MTKIKDSTEAEQQRLRELAYSLWEADGRPHGRDQEYWQRAVAQMDVSDTAPVEGKAAPSGPSKNKPKAGDAPMKAAGTRRAAGKSAPKRQAAKTTPGTKA